MTQGSGKNTWRAEDDPVYRHYPRLLDGGTKTNLTTVNIARQIASIVVTVWQARGVYDPRRLERAPHGSMVTAPNRRATRLPESCPLQGESHPRTFHPTPQATVPGGGTVLLEFGADGPIRPRSSSTGRSPRPDESSRIDRSLRGRYPRPSSQS